MKEIPSVSLSYAVNEIYYGNHPYKNPVIGYKKDIETLTREDIYNYYKKFYSPNNAAIAIGGNFSLREAREVVKKYFGDIKPAAPILNSDYKYVQKSESRNIKIKRKTSASYLQILIPEPPLSSGENAAFSFAELILTEGKSSRLYKALVDTGIALDIKGRSNSVAENSYYVFSITLSSPENGSRSISWTYFFVLIVFKLLTFPFHKALNNSKRNVFYSNYTKIL